MNNPPSHAADKPLLQMGRHIHPKTIGTSKNQQHTLYEIKADRSLINCKTSPTEYFSVII